MDHRVRVATIVFWALFFINFVAAGYVILQYTLNAEIFGNVPAVFIAAINTIVTLVAAIGMSMGESYRI